MSEEEKGGQSSPFRDRESAFSARCVFYHTPNKNFLLSLSPRLAESGDWHHINMLYDIARLTMACVAISVREAHFVPRVLGILPHGYHLRTPAHHPHITPNRSTFDASFRVFPSSSKTAVPTCV